MTLQLDSIDNFRDVAGDPPYTAGATRLRPGVVWRSSALTLDDADQAALEALEPALVIDLRSAAEIAQAPDVDVRGAVTARVDIIGEAEDSRLLDASRAGGLGAVGLAEEHDVGLLMYRTFVTDPGAARAFGRAARMIADAPGPVVMHCTAGKDRTGWLAAVVQTVAGVSDEDVMRDYLLSNERLARVIARLREQIEAAVGPEKAAAFAGLLGVAPRFLDAARAAVAEQYGDMRGYLRDGGGLSDADIDRLVARITV
ncbi:tyrosine-protein phosphatase [Microbacterium gorillae]|uniref:tyrosine-protein phosphatase n=1 Tax=Microbacterium gorillae TaxID=1231063 RepID=UPI0006947ED1|nr:tyrosine-protein phosphatase [Microbacterium gorillae]